MTTVSLNVYHYVCDGNKVTEVKGLETLLIEDREKHGDGDGRIDQKELAEYFNVGNGKLRGTKGPEDRDVEFTVSDTGNLHDKFDLYTTRPDLQVGGTIDTDHLVQNFSPFDPNCGGVPCFAGDTLIETARGPVAASDLVVGDMVRTRDAGFQPVRWVGQRRLSAARLAQARNLVPIRIKAGALGANTPATDLVVSPQHRVLVRSRIAQKMFGVDEVLVAAKQLLQIDGIDLATDLAGVTYVHLLLDDHAIVFSNGAETESLHTGTEALKSVGPAARDEIFSIFPELRDGAAERAGARMMPSGRMARRLAVRHLENRKPLVG